MEENTANKPQTDGNTGAGSFFGEIVKFTTLAIVIVAPIRWFVAQPFIVSGASMYPTFDDANYLIVDELSYYFREPARGEVVIFKYPNDTSKYFIKRVVGLPGETVDIDSGVVSIISDDGSVMTTLDESYVKYQSETSMRVVLRSNEYFVLGDNRAASSDSRMWGPVARNLIIGDVFVRLYPFNKIELHPGSATLTK
ncbi:MAG: signal peptidase I [Candidatus Vogelbacteria bacterium]|nr:signal peptidase I [Candidatus Vogelbacteria bacterium]